MTDYGRIGTGIALALIIGGAVFVLIGVVALWISGPIWVAILMTVLVLATTVMIACFEVDRRR